MPQHLLAADKTHVPPTAKLQTKAQIIAIYDGKPFSWSHPFTDKGSGTMDVVAATSTMSGTYDMNGKKGEWEGKITWKGDQCCGQERAKGGKKYNPMHCQLVYLDGSTVYEVDAKTKVITSVNNPR